MRVSGFHLDLLVWDTENDAEPRLIGKRLDRATLAEDSEVEFPVSISEEQRDISLRVMMTRDRQFIPILTGYGRLNGSDETWIQKGETATPQLLETGERYTSQTLFRWNDKFWIIGTRLRPSVPLGLVLMSSVTECQRFKRSIEPSRESLSSSDL